MSFEMPAQRQPARNGGGFNSLANHKEDMQRLKNRADAQNASRDNFPEFSCKPGETTKFIILDREEDVFDNYEHQTRFDPAPGQKYGAVITTPCLNHGEERGPCPACSAGKVPFKAIHLSGLQPPTVSELKSAEKNGKTLRNYYRRHMRVKSVAADNDQISYIYKTLTSAPVRAMQREKRGQEEIRGTVVEITRAGQTSAKSGQWTVINVLSEEQILKHYGHAAIVRDNGKVAIPENGYLQVFPYAEKLGTPDSNDRAAIEDFARHIAQAHRLEVPREAYRSEPSPAKAEFGADFGRSGVDDEIPFAPNEASPSSAAERPNFRFQEEKTQTVAAQDAQASQPTSSDPYAANDDADEIPF